MPLEAVPCWIFGTALWAIIWPKTIREYAAAAPFCPTLQRTCREALPPPVVFPNEILSKDARALCTQRRCSATQRRSTSPGCSAPSVRS